MNGHRVVPLNSTAREALTEWMAGLPRDAPPCLFPSRKKGEKSGNGDRELKPVSDRALGYVVAKYARLARVEDVSPHDLRHRFGYETAKRVPLHRPAQIMGHDSSDTTGPDAARLAQGPGHLVQPGGDRGAGRRALLLRAIGADRLDVSYVTPNRLKLFAAVGRRYTNQALRRLCSNLLTDAVVTCNTVYYQKILDRLAREGYPVGDEDVAYLWPTRHAHINPYGKYTIDVDGEPGGGAQTGKYGHRPLRPA